MKIKTVIFCAILLAFTACSKNAEHLRPSSRFDELSEMLKKEPTNALFLLEQDTISFYNPEYQLLLAEARYLNNCHQDDGEGLVSAMKYYDSLSNLYSKNEFLINQKAKAHCFYGIKEFEDENYVNAVENYLKALKIAKHMDDDFKLLIYNKLFDCFTNNDCYHEALEFALKIEDVNTIDYCLANISLENGDYSKALKLFDILVKRSQKSDVSDYEYGIARCYFCKNDLDSAILHYEQVLAGENHMLAAAASDLVELYREKCDTAMYLKYSDLYFSLSSHRNPIFLTSSRISVLYNDFKNSEIAEYEQLRRNQKNVVVLIMIVAVVLVTGCILIRYKKNKERELQKIKEESENKFVDMQKSLTKQKNMLENAREKAGGIGFLQRLTDYENNEICLLIKNRIEARDVSRKTISDCYKLALNGRETVQLVTSANGCFPMFSSLLVDNLGVKGDNIVYCCLSLLGFSISEIAVLMKITYQAANKRINSIKEVLKTNGTIKECLTKYFSDIYG